jgi:hypothetical protein
MLFFNSLTYFNSNQQIAENKKPDKVSVQIDDEQTDAQQQQAQANHIVVAELRNNPKSPIGALKQQTQDDEGDTTSTASSDEEQPSVVRQNLLG